MSSYYLCDNCVEPTSLTKRSAANGAGTSTPRPCSIITARAGKRCGDKPRDVCRDFGPREDA